MEAAPMDLSTHPPLFSFGRPWPHLNDGLLYRDVISSRDSGLTVGEFYASKYASSAPVEGWLQRIDLGQITIDGEVNKKPDTLLSGGSTLVYHRLPWKEPDAPYTINVLHEDDDILVLDKPSGLQVLPGGLFQQRTLLQQLKWLRSTAVPVHRLGRGTSGVLLCAKTKSAKRRLSSYFAYNTSLVSSTKENSLEEPQFKKCYKLYRTIVRGIITREKVVVNQPIGVEKYPGVATGLYVASSTGKPAQTTVHVLERNESKNQTLVKVMIESGRPHQIRIHMAYLGHPLIGDPLYDIGGKPIKKLVEPEDKSIADDGGYKRTGIPLPGDCGYLLHAHELIFEHPTTQQVRYHRNSNRAYKITNVPMALNMEMVKIEAPVPPTLASLFMNYKLHRINMEEEDYDTN